MLQEEQEELSLTNVTSQSQSINSLANHQRKVFYNQCQNILSQILKSENSYFFFRPVDPEQDRAPDYFKIIVSPMSLYDVQQKIDKNQYETPEEFIKDMRLIWHDAKQYNAPSHLIYKAADVLSHKFEMLASTLPHTINEASLNSAFQREVELRFARYRLQKKTHL